MTTVDPTTVDLDWNDAKSAAGYRLWVSNVKDGGTTPPEAAENIIEGRTTASPSCSRACGTSSSA
ncbi:hypothetical protein [Streptomyces rochei]|uniref:hypothetical protein n=1 Tax=Streptomyces rochei TaxID=1928 RepID=UPI0040396AAE